MQVVHTLHIQGMDRFCEHALYRATDINGCCSARQKTYSYDAYPWSRWYPHANLPLMAISPLFSLKSKNHSLSSLSYDSASGSPFGTCGFSVSSHWTLPFNVLGAYEESAESILCLQANAVLVLTSNLFADSLTVNLDSRPLSDLGEPCWFLQCEKNCSSSGAEALMAITAHVSLVARSLDRSVLDHVVRPTVRVQRTLFNCLFPDGGQDALLTFQFQSVKISLKVRLFLHTEEPETAPKSLRSLYYLYSYSWFLYTYKVYKNIFQIISPFLGHSDFILFLHICKNAVLLL